MQRRDHRRRDELGDYRRKRDPPRTPEPFGGARGRGRAALRDPAPRRAAAALRPPARAGRRARELGGAERAAVPRRRAPPRRARRGPPARLRDVRGRDPGGPVRRGHGRDLGPRHVRARSRRSGTAASRSASTASAPRASGRSSRRTSTANEQNWLLLRKDGGAADAELRARSSRRSRSTLPTGTGLARTSRSGTATARSSRVAGGEATLTSRNGTDLTERFRDVARAAARAVRTPSAVLDGEVCALDETGAARFEALQRAPGGSS